MKGIAKIVIPFFFSPPWHPFVSCRSIYLFLRRKAMSESLIRIAFRNNACPIVFH